MAAADCDKRHVFRSFETFESDAEAACFVASLLQISEYRLFRIAYWEWFGTEPADKVMDRCFAVYLADGVVPFWARDLVRKALDKYGNDELDPLEFGVAPAPTTAAEKRIGWALLAALCCLVTAYGWFLVWLSAAIERSWRP